MCFLILSVEILAILMVVLVICGGESLRCVEREREALLTFKHSLVDEYGVLSSWGESEECCQWEGVTCSTTTGHMTSLQLSTLRGDSLNSALHELHHLKDLYVSESDFGGSRVPEFVCSMKSLRTLELSNSNFSGRIPPGLANLTNLRLLNLRDNQLWSQDITWLSHLSFLSALDLSSSHISDTNWLQHILEIPSLEELYLPDCQLTDVKSIVVNSSFSPLSLLNLHHNELTSSAFDWLFNISRRLYDINIWGNKLDGPIPEAFGELVHLSSLDLSNNMLEGGIPKSFGNLIHLRHLDVSGNELGGSLEESMGNLSCNAMESLILSNNRLTGSVPDTRKCVQLLGLHLNGNNLVGPLPPSLGQLSHLVYLDLSHNSFQGTISDAHFAKLENLLYMDLSFNSIAIQFSPGWIPPFQLSEIHLGSCKMGPSFPTWLQSQRNFGVLDLSSSGLTGQVPEWFWNAASNVRDLNISHNKLSGTIPYLHQSLYKLGTIDVSSNMFSGPLPLLRPEIWVIQFSQNMFTGTNISSFLCTSPLYLLRLVDISSNLLSGTLPNCWENMESLVVLNMNNNNLSSQIPHSLGSLRSLRTLHLGRNSFVGNLPSTLKNCRLLQAIDVGGNKLSGRIPPWLGDIHANMVHLSLRGNGFYGSIPLEICRLAHIQVLDLSGNNISGKIPKCFGNFTALVDKNITSTTSIHVDAGFNKFIDYALVQWKGVEAEYTNTLGLLKLVDLSSNKLDGRIPRVFSHLRGLISLNLSRNRLTGSMDPNIGEMEMLECLDLSGNQLSGRIPIGLAQLNFLNVLDLSNNSLSGKIPPGTQLQSFNGSVFGGNSDLCGKPLKLCPGDDPKPCITCTAGQDIEEDSDGFFGLSFMQEFGISMAFGCIFGFWGFVGSLLLNKSWRSAYFNFFRGVEDWLYVTATLFFNKFFRQS